jgi:predicted nucleic acid-binding protein
LNIYLDVCCLNRPFDDQSQERIRLESEAVLLALAQVQDSVLYWFSSEIVTLEIMQTSDVKKRERLTLLSNFANHKIAYGRSEENRAKEIETLGFHSFDAMHLACSESAKVDFFLTTDDRLLRKAKHLKKQLKINVVNPLVFILN